MAYQDCTIESALVDGICTFVPSGGVAILEKDGEELSGFDFWVEKIAYDDGMEEVRGKEHSGARPEWLGATLSQSTNASGETEGAPEFTVDERGIAEGVSYVRLGLEVTDGVTPPVQGLFDYAPAGFSEAAGYRFFRWYNFENVGGSFQSRYRGYTELELYEQAGGASALVGNTLIDSQLYKGAAGGAPATWREGSAQGLFDGDLQGRQFSDVNDIFIVEAEFQAAVDPVAIGIGPYSPDPENADYGNGRSVKDFRLEASVDGETWEVLYENAALDWSGHAFPETLKIAL